MQVELFSNQEELFDISMFEIDQESQLVNITKIAKVFGKNVNDWSKTAQTQSFFNAFRKKYGETNIIVSKFGGNSQNQGTWVHRKVAIKFAAWISSEFEVWCIDMLDKLFQTGTVSLNPVKLPTYPELLRQHADLVEAHEKIVEEVKVIQPKVEYVNKVLDTESAYTVGTIANELGMTANKLNKLLNEMKVIYKVDKQWVLYAQHRDKELTKIRTTLYDEDTKTSHLLVWTEKGRNYIHNLINPQLTKLL